MKLTSQANGSIQVKNQGKNVNSLVSDPVPESWWSRPEQREWSRLAGIKEEPPKHFEMEV